MRDPELDHMHAKVIQRAKDPDCTCLQAMADLKEEIVRKNPNAHDTDKNTRRVKQTAAKKHQNDKHQNCKPQHQAQGGNKNCHPNAKTIMLKNGKKLKHHLSFRFDDDDFKLFTHKQKRTLFNERRAANQSEKNNKEKMESRILKSLMSHVEDNSAVFEITQQNNTPPNLPSSIVGGRDSQEKRNGGGQTK